MAKKKPATESEIVRELEAVRKAIKLRKLKDHAVSVASDNKHPLRKHINSYPPLPFEISPDDLKIIAMLKAFPKSLPLDHDWTPLEKIFYALLWKDGKLKSIGRIVEGVEHASERLDSNPKQGVVYHFFGRHLVDRLKEPVIDQNTVRAFRLIKPGNAGLAAIRKEGIPTLSHARAYCDWFLRILDAESIETYADSRSIDVYLFALGKFAKMSD